MKDILFSIVILTYNNLYFTEQCLKAVIAHTHSPYELILIDNGSTDATVKFLKGLKLPFMKKKINSMNLGFAKGGNQGAALAEGKYLVFLNNDTLPEENWVEELGFAIEKFNRIGIVGSLLLFPDRTIQHSGVGFGPPYYVHHLYKGKEETYPPAQTPRILQAVTGACLLIPRNLFFQVHGFEENYLNGFEDLDLCFKVRKQGYRILYWPKSVLVHFESLSSGRKKWDEKNLQLFKEKWDGFVLQDIQFYP
jgi:GT2 family glycosyltransferase